MIARGAGPGVAVDLPDTVATDVHAVPGETGKEKEKEIEIEGIETGIGVIEIESEIEGIGIVKEGRKMGEIEMDEQKIGTTSGLVL